MGGVRLRWAAVRPDLQDFDVSRVAYQSRVKAYENRATSCSVDRHSCGDCPGAGADVDDNDHHQADVGRGDPIYHNRVRRIIVDDADQRQRFNEYDNLSAARLRLSADGLQWL
jgi:hypothetical protein